ncbi:hypothetical protein E4T56_gene16902 [Termitomyces sp. T112]|nr:hypothetical protein E4T56_gene16902 [Termitomyces sp. T112]
MAPLTNNDIFVLLQSFTAELLVSSITEDTLIDSLKSLNEWFPAIKYLDLIVEDAGSYEPSTVLSTALSLLPRLATLRTKFFNKTELIGVSS